METQRDSDKTKMTRNNIQANGSSNLEMAQSNQDLIMTKGKRKKRTWIIIGVATLICTGLIVAAIVLLETSESKKLPQRGDETPALALEDVLYGRLSPQYFNASWVSGSELLYRDSDGNLVLRDVRSLKSPPTVILPNSDPIMLTAFEHRLSADRKYLLISHDYQKLYRYSYKAKHTLINLETGERGILSVKNNQDLQLVKWSPVGNALVMVSDNNIYYKKAANESSILPLTSDPTFVYNGVPDWVYEEEVFSSNNALWFSPDGARLAYGRFDDREVPIMVIPIYGEPGSLLFQYPRANVIRYPKAGAKNPVASLHVVDLDNPTVVEKLSPPTDLIHKQPILCAASWATNDTISAIWMNRVQNEAAIVTYNTNQPYTTEIVKSLSETEGWLELFTPPMFSSDGSQMVLILSQDQGEDLGSYRHIALISRKQNAEIIPLTSGAYVVTEIIGWDDVDNLVYYLANTPTDSAVQHLFSVCPITKDVKCLTCNIKSKNEGKRCLYNTVDFSKDHTHYTLTCSGPGVPEIAIYTKENKRILDWNHNEPLLDLIRKKRTPVMRRLVYEIADGFRALVNLKLPPNLDTSGNTKYPMLVNVYGGPDSYQVIEKFNLDWGSYLAANKSIIYATIDGRGSGLRGDKLLFSLYRHLGTLEIVDQINVTRQIQDTLPYVDAKRTAIWGWSYGGYASGLALATDTEGIYKCGISVAPVTDWALYDSIYTERFMGLPTIEDNYKGYQEAQLLKKYRGLRGKQYFLVHGTYDDNVHYQQSMLWSKVLEQNDILFRQQSYPDEDHGLGSVRPHLYHSLESFLDECFIEEGNE